VSDEKDTESVDELLGVDDSKLKFAKKHLRIQRAKTLPSKAAAPKPAKQGGARGKEHKGKEQGSRTATATARPAMSRPAGPIPKGNPLLGEKIRGLSKDERKVAKSADEERQARRMAKKKLRGKMDVEKGAVKLLPSKGEKARGKKVVAKKSRVRSSHALSKMKGSRA
jgi:nucleolar protein 12